MRKYIYGIAILILVGVVLIVLGGRDNPSDNNYSQDLFSQRGYVSQQEETLSLVYEKPGAPGLFKKLVFDKESICMISGEALLCESEQVDKEEFVGKEVFVEGIEDQDSVIVRTIAPQKESGRIFGFVNEVVENSQNVLVHINIVEFLSGDEALEKALGDTDCTVETITDCVPSMNNNFYIRDVEQENEVYILTQESSIRVFQSPGSPVLKEVSLEGFLEASKDNSFTSYPIMIIPDGATILELEQQYLP